MPLRDVTIWHLVLEDRAAFRPRRSDRAGVVVAKVPVPTPELNRFLYTAIGGDWYWIDRLPWDRATWMRRLSQPGLETWVMTVDGIPAGFYELETIPDGRVEVAIFGVMPAYAGQGLGAHLLTTAVENAWAMGARVVYLNTCSLDHPGARSNYDRRGFRVERVETIAKSLPDRAPGPWPGAHGTPA